MGTAILKMAAATVGMGAAIVGWGRSLWGASRCYGIFYMGWGGRYGMETIYMG